MDSLTIKTAFVKGIISKIITRRIEKIGFKESEFGLENLHITKGEDSDKLVIDMSFNAVVDKNDLEKFLKHNDIL